MDFSINSSNGDRKNIVNLLEDGHRSAMIGMKNITKEKKDKRHELRKELKLLKMSNMKMRKQLRLSLRVRFLNGVRLEDEIVQLNKMLLRLKSAVIEKDNALNEIVFEGKFVNPEKAKFQSTSNSCVDSQTISSIYNHPEKKQKEPNRFYCEICEFRCAKRTPFEIHMRRHANNRPYVCNHCERRFITQYDLKVHAKRHIASREFSCDRCEFKTYRADMLLIHKDKHVSSKTYKCDQCGFKTVERFKMVTHRKCHGEMSDTKSCLACGVLKKPLQQSNEDDKANVTNEVTDKIGSVLANDISELSVGRPRLSALRHTCTKPWTCHFCGMSFKKKESLTKHLRTHTGERPHNCDQCHYSAATRHTLLVHKRTHTGEKPYACTHCEFRCTTKGYLKIHLNKHEGIKPYACTECDYRSVDSCKLSAHKKVKHSDEKPFSCDRCPFTTKLAARLRQHKMRHDAGKLVCRHCGQGFKIHATLVEHEGSHTGDQPFKCTQCCVEKRFTLESSYKRHLARHKLRFECPLCPYKTGLRKDLLRHSKLHIGGGGKCVICGKRCINNDLMMRHMQIRHPNSLLNVTNHSKSNKADNTQIDSTNAANSNSTANLVGHAVSKNISKSTSDETAAIDHNECSSLIACNVSTVYCPEDTTVQMNAPNNSMILTNNTAPIVHTTFTNTSNVTDTNDSANLPISVNLLNSATSKNTCSTQSPMTGNRSQQSYQKLNPTILNIPQSVLQSFHQVTENVASNSEKNTANPHMMQFPNPQQSTFYWGQS